MRRAAKSRTGSQPSAPPPPPNPAEVLSATWRSSTASVSPVVLPLSRLAAALAVGNTLVWQPPPHASVVATTLARHAHFPAGVLNVVLGSDDVAVALARADIAGFHIIGTPSLARWLCGEALDVGGRVVAEVSGSAVAIVLAGANLEDAAERITRAAFAFAGQRSGAIKRVVVESRIGEHFLELLSDQVSRLKVGDPGDKSVVMGPLRDAISVQRATEFVDARTAAGAACHVGGAAMPELGDAFFEPTLLGPSTRQEPLSKCDGTGDHACRRRRRRCPPAAGWRPSRRVHPGRGTATRAPDRNGSRNAARARWLAPTRQRVRDAFRPARAHPG